MPALGAAALIVLFLYYWLARPWGTVGLLHVAPPLPPFELESLGTTPWLGSLPSFLHTFAFAVLSWASVGRRHAGVACAFWLALNVAIELGQGLSKPLIERLPNVLTLHETLAAGTLDALDLAACTFGAATALILTMPGCGSRGMQND